MLFSADTPRPLLTVHDVLQRWILVQQRSVLFQQQQRLPLLRAVWQLFFRLLHSEWRQVGRRLLLLPELEWRALVQVSRFAQSSHHACGEDSALQVLQVLGGLEQAYQPCAKRERGVCVDRWEPRAQYASHASASSTLQAVRSGTPCSCRALDTFESRSLLVCLVGFCFFTMDIFCVSSFSR